MDKKTSYTAMDDQPLRRPAKDHEGDVIQPADPPENPGGGTASADRPSEERAADPPENQGGGS